MKLLEKLRKDGLIPFRLSQKKITELAMKINIPVAKLYYIYKVYRLYSGGSNYLDMESYIRMYREMNPKCSGYAPTVARCVFERYDQNRDGYLTYYEFLASALAAEGYNLAIPVPNGQYVYTYPNFAYQANMQGYQPYSQPVVFVPCYPQPHSKNKPISQPPPQLPPQLLPPQTTPTPVPTPVPISVPVENYGQDNQPYYPYYYPAQPPQPPQQQSIPQHHPNHNSKCHRSHHRPRHQPKHFQKSYERSSTYSSSSPSSYYSHNSSTDSHDQRREYREQPINHLSTYSNSQERLPTRDIPIIYKTVKRYNPSPGTRKTKTKIIHIQNGSVISSGSSSRSSYSSYY